MRGVSSAREARELTQALAPGEGDDDGARKAEVGTCHVMAEEEFLPFAPESFDLVLRCAAGLTVTFTGQVGSGRVGSG